MRAIGFFSVRSATLALVFGSLMGSGCVPVATYNRQVRKRLAAEGRSREFAERVQYLEDERNRLYATVSNHKVEQAKLAEMLEAAKGAIDWSKYGLDGNQADGGLVLAGDLTFRSGSHHLSAKGKATLNKVARALIESGVAKVRVEGHTDADPLRHKKGLYRDNLHLSVMRAHAVAQYLSARGVKRQIISIAGFGSHAPRGRKKADNRRVEIRALVEEESQPIRVSKK